ncbi:MAG: hypothetical protein IJL70_07040 [Treponema sp.]|nr:hypothetical protein [Treponema sp.]
MSFFYKVQAEQVFLNKKEAARYSGYISHGNAESGAEPGGSFFNLIDESCKKMQKILVPQAVYEEFDLSIVCSDDEKVPEIKFGGISFKSRDLAKNLKDCKKIILLAATIGTSVDMMIRRAQQCGSADAAIMQGVGAMFIESFVDDFNERLCRDYELKGCRLHPRFSPGYGDVPLEIQKYFFSLLPCSKIGLSLMDTLIMAPEKSVTAFIGIEV